MSDENKTGLFITSILLFCSVIIATMLTVFFVQHPPENVYHNLELICYSAYCLIVVCISHFIVRKLRKASLAVWLTIFTSAIVATATVILLNNLWHYLDFNRVFKGVDPLAYWYFVKYDLQYAINYAWIRYPLIFLCSLIGGIVINARAVFTKRKISD